MKVLIMALAVMTLAFTGLSCGQSAANSSLKVAAVPSTPYLIPVGNGTTVSGYFNLTAPYFVVNSLNVVWGGKDTLQIVAILIYQSGTNTNVTTAISCGFGGTDLSVIFPNNVSTGATTADGSAGTIFIAPSTTPTPILSSAFGCGGLGVTIDPTGQTKYNINLTLYVYGVTVDSSGNTTGRVTGQTTISIQ